MPWFKAAAVFLFFLTSRTGYLPIHDHKTYIRIMRTIFTLCLFLSAYTSIAQWDAGLGARINFPLMYNEAVGDYNHSLGAFGPVVSARYYPRNMTFYPSVSSHYTQVRLPLVKESGTVVGAILSQFSFTVGANIRKTFQNNRELHYGLGIGISYFLGKGLEIAGTNQGNIMSVNYATSTQIKRWVPAVMPRIEYVFPISQEKPLFAGIAGQVQYIYFFDDGSAYDVQVVTQQYQQLKLNASLRGHMVNPGVQLSVYYRFGDTNAY